VKNILKVKTFVLNIYFSSIKPSSTSGISLIMYIMDAATTSWYTTRFITTSLKQYLKEKGFRLSEPEEQDLPNFDNSIVSSKLLSKEVIEIRGTVSEAVEGETEELVGKNDNGFIEVIHLLLDIMLSPINFFNSINGNEGNRCLCLPDTDQYRRVLDKLKDYFVSNKLHLKIYLVDQNGSVDVFYLNPEKKQRA